MIRACLIKNLLHNHRWRVQSGPVPLEDNSPWNKVSLRCARCGEQREPLTGDGLTLDRPEVLAGCGRRFHGRYTSGDFLAIPSPSGGEQVAYFGGYQADGRIHVRPAGTQAPHDLPPEKVRPVLA